MRRFLAEAVPLFEAASGIKVALRFAQTRVAMKEIEEGAVFDLALLPRSAIDAVDGARQDRPRHRGRCGALDGGLDGAPGAPAPDIGTVDALKSALRQAKSISYSKGPSGEYVAELLQRLGLAGEMQDKTVFAVGRFVGEVVANGEAEIGMQQIIESAPVEGSHLVGPLPPELTNYVLYSAGFAGRHRERRGSR